MKFTVGSVPLTLTQLGRWVVAGNHQAHLIKLVDAATGSDVTGGSVSLSLNGATAGQYAFAALSSPVILLPGSSYFLLSQETSGGDQWCNYGAIAASPFGSVSGPAYGTGNSYLAPSNNPNSSYVPVNFLFSH